MSEDSIRLELDYIKHDIVEIKAEAKEYSNKMSIDLLYNHDANIRNEIKLENIEKSQNSLIEIVTEIKNKPLMDWRKMSNFWKFSIIGAVIGFVVPWIIGNFMTFTKIFGGN